MRGGAGGQTGGPATAPGGAGAGKTDTGGAGRVDGPTSGSGARGAEDARPGQAGERGGRDAGPAQRGERDGRADRDDRPDRDVRGERDGRGERGGRVDRSEVRGAVSRLDTRQRTEFRQTVTRSGITPLRSVDFRVSVGTRVPRSVRLSPIPAALLTLVPAYRGYEVVLVEDDILIIDPDTLEIVDVIQG
jgi:hypothetical protein